MRAGPEGLLARVFQTLDLGDAVYGQTEKLHTSSRQCRGVFVDLLKSKDSGFTIGPEAIAEARAWSDHDAHVCRELIMGGVFWLMLPTTGASPASTGWPLQVRIAASVSKTGEVTLTADGPALHLIVLQLLTLLRDLGVSRLQHCDCGRRFIRVGRQEFCSERCQNRVYMRRRRRQEALA